MVHMMSLLLSGSSCVYSRLPDEPG